MQSDGILVIEDVFAFVCALRAMLPAKSIHSVGTLREAFHSFKARRWGKVVLDLDLPDSSLESTVAMIPAIKLATHDAMLIVLTGYDVDREALLQLGVAAVIQKHDTDWLTRLQAML